MHCIATYPISEEAITQYCGTPVMAVSHSGDQFIGTLDSCREGHLYMASLQHSYASAAVSNIEKKAKKNKKYKRWANGKKRPVNISKKSLEKASISFFPAGLGFGLGAGIGFALPLFALGALFTFPFFI